MRIIFTLILYLLIFPHVFAQERTISGRLTSHEDGSPLPGISISIKGTATGTVTDADGYYSITAPIGSTLVFSFVGMKTQEVVVTEDHLKPGNGTTQKESTKHKNVYKNETKPIPGSLFKDTVQNKQGVAVLTEKTRTYKSSVNIDPAFIRSIKKFGNYYIIKSDITPKRTGVGLQFSSAFGVERINKLPSFQNKFAQGRPVEGSLRWQGAYQQEIYSWGPLIRTLEFNDDNYSFDRNGALVPIGQGNGNRARAHDARFFFRTGLTTVNELTVTLPAPGNGTWVFDVENRNRKGIIPNADYQKLNFSSNLKNFSLAHSLKGNASVSFNRSAGSLLNRGANLASIVGSVCRTPITFDNANGLSGKQALNTAESYTLENGTIRSHAPGLADNPFGLVSELPDNETLQRLISSLNLQYSGDTYFDINFNGNIDRQWSDIVFGLPVGYSGFSTGRITNRSENQTVVNAGITPSYRFYPSSGELKLSVSYQTQYAQRLLNRSDGFNLTNREHGDSIVILNKSISRAIHEIVFNTQYEFSDWFNARFTNRNYLSNTVRSSDYTNIFPSASISIDLADLLHLWPINDLQIYTSISRTIREAPLLYSNWSYGSTRMSVENYNSFYEATELFFSKNLKPEIERKFETGVKFYGPNGRLNFEFAYFNNHTDDFITPVWSHENFQLQNAATVKNYGATFSTGYRGHMYRGRWGTELRWSKYNSKVEEIYTNEPWIPVAGFELALSVLAPGKPVGALYGTTYLRDNTGRLIIDDDGFPIEDPELKMIGNIIPRWTLGWSSFIEWKQFKFSFVFDVKKGGDLWNGTNAVLDYLGRSANTGKLRNTSNYLFEGVTTNGMPNTVLVDFANPEDGVTQNRWTRYGWDGVGEDYIEDASWIRLNELTLSYTLHRGWNRTIKAIKFSLAGRNLFLITPYSGVDPSATLFGYSTTTGLDLFNTPATRNYTAQVTIKI